MLEVGEPVVLVLDDYHLVTNPDVHRSVDYLLRWGSSVLRLVIGTRSDPPLRIGRLRAAGELLEIRAADLAFTDEEAGQLLHTLDIDLDEDNLARLGRRTEGWAAGLHLAGLSMRHRTDPGAFLDAFTGTDRFVLDYLGAEVLAAQTDDVRRFLVETSILPRLSADLCAVITGRSDSAAVLAHLERTNGFLVALDDRQEWYRYHRLFGELLRHELTLDEPERLPELHRRAARWFHAAGDVAQAIDHALAAGDVDLAEDLVLAHW